MKRNFLFCLCGLILPFMTINAISAQEKAAPEEQQLLPKQIKFDRNFDGKVDRLEIYNEKGVIVRLEVDTTGDGKMNEWVFFTNGIRNKAEKDINRDGKPDTFITYDAKGVIIKLEGDTTGNGKINEWVYYKDGKPTRAERDTNADGKPDTWITY
ncbi:MAG: hypothetical protein JRI34_01120 [Deltaproteobacteria bacterium]|nr:hypothetical protein [Deltaproteobacteria bacterium]